MAWNAAEIPTSFCLLCPWHPGSRRTQQPGFLPTDSDDGGLNRSLLIPTQWQLWVISPGHSGVLLVWGISRPCFGIIRRTSECWAQGFARDLYTFSFHVRPSVLTCRTITNWSAWKRCGSREKGRKWLDLLYTFTNNPESKSLPPGISMRLTQDATRRNRIPTSRVRPQWVNHPPRRSQSPSTAPLGARGDCLAACLVGHQSDMVSLGLVQGCFKMYWGLLRVSFRVGLRFCRVSS